MYPGGGVEHFTGSEQLIGVETELAIGVGDPDPAESDELEVPQAQTNAIVSAVAVCLVKRRMSTANELTERALSKG